jgi:ParB family chromosome partitioning protein
MADSVTLLPPKKIDRNPENPRLIFHQDELDALEESISKQGILVPLTVYQDKGSYFILDGERRWRCSIKLGLSKVPVIVQPKPDRMRNIMMMFAIHKARRDWDPLPTANKLVALEDEYEKRNGRKPSEAELAGIASLSRGEVRRLKKLLSLPLEEREMLMNELEKPRGKQELTADQLLEATKGAEALRKRDVIDKQTESALRKALISKFRSKVINNTIAPRKLARLARAVERNEVTSAAVQRVVTQLIRDPAYTIDAAFSETVEQADFEHSVDQLIERVSTRLQEHRRRQYKLSAKLRAALVTLRADIDRLLD